MSDGSMTVYCTKGTVIFNSDRNFVDSEKKPKGMKIKKNICNPIFEDMRKHNDDPFWDMFLLKASRDNFPKGFSFRDNVLFFSLKSKYNFEIKLDITNISESFIKLKDFVSDKGILSDTDKLNLSNKQLENNCLNNEETIESWKDLGKMQNNAIYIYISILSECYNLDIKERKNLESMIKIGISSGYLNTKNIIVKKSIIEEIIPLEWNKESRLFMIDTKNIRIKKTKGIKIENTDLSTDNTTTCLDFEKKYNISNVNKRWEKFLSAIYKVS